MLNRLLAIPILALFVAIPACGPREPTATSSSQGNADKPKEVAAIYLPPLFEDVTARSGLNFSYRNGEETANHYAILESLGGGVGLIDFDGDGLLDVFVVGGGQYAGEDRKQIVGLPCKLYRNLGGMKFEDSTASAGLATLGNGAPWFYSHGVAVADYNRDGWPDLLVTGWKAIALFKNAPVDAADPKKGRKFVDATREAGLADGITWASSAAFGDLDGDGFPELYVCQYVNWSWENNPKCSYAGNIPDVCPPKNFEGLTHKLYRNNGRGGFVEVGKEAGLKAGSPTESKGLGVLIADLDGDGKPDIYVANDTVDKFLYMNRSTRGQLAFDERALVSNCARDDRGSANGSMGLELGDPFRDGHPTLWVTNYEHELHSLYQYIGTPGKPYFSYRTVSSGIGAIGRKYVGWGTAFIDADLDGWEDLFVANGHAIRNPQGKDAARKQNAVFLANESRHFVSHPDRLGAYGLVDHNGRGVAMGDLDNDGHPDLVISHVNEPLAILRGIGGAGRHWLGIELQGADHACVVGTIVSYESKGGRQVRFARGGGSYASAPDQRLLFGLGDDDSGQLTVTWPSGVKQTFKEVKADRYYRVSPKSDTLQEVPARKN